MITVYCAPHCADCYHTVRWLAHHHIEFTEVQATEKDRQWFKDNDFDRFPVVVTSDRGTWCGFRIDRLMGLRS